MTTVTRHDRGMGTKSGRTEIFEAERARLTAAAYRMLGSWAESEDAVQEAWLRFSQVDLDEIREPRAWLTTVVGRICLDVLRSARVRREAYVGSWLPEPIVASLPARDADGSDPAEVAQLREDVGMALLVVLERLTPEQRVAFVLHDVFAVPFNDVAETLGTTAEAARQLASRARQAVNGGTARRRTADRAEQRRIVTAFLTAARTGDMEALLAVLAPDAVIVGDGGGVVPTGRSPLEGALAAARFLLGLFRRARGETSLELVPALVNGDVGVVGEATVRSDRSTALGAPGQVIRFVMAFEIVDGLIVGIYDQLNPAKLTAVPRLAELGPATPG